jgi:exopolyphosphatase/guanosine-5'-triphosphate,3'-diphosphate pyrophosphatase
MDPHKLAIIDIGSKTVRLSIYEETNSAHMEEIKKEKVSLRLSQHVVNGSLSKDGIDQLINVLMDFKKIIHSYGVVEVKCIATAAIRNAKNQKGILSSVEEHTPFSIRLLSGEEEAQYGLLAITQSIAIADGIAIDLGGGSTEITLFRNRKLVETVSIPFGVVTLTNRFSDGLPMSDDAYNQLSAYVNQEISSLDWIAGLSLPIIGIGGSIRLIGKYSLRKKQLTRGLNGYTLLKEEVNNIVKEMKNMTIDELSTWAKDSADLAMPALTVLNQLMIWTASEEIICCTKGIKDGLIYSKMNG